jgi:hypothetical protein
MYCPNAAVSFMNALLLAATILNGTAAFFNLFSGELLFAPYCAIAGLNGPSSGFGMDFAVSAANLTHPRLVVSSDISGNLAGERE